MATPTANYGFIKDAPTQLYDVSVVNANLDAIDAAIKAQDTITDGISTENAALDTRLDFIEAKFPNGLTGGVGVPRCRLTQTSTQSFAHNVSEVFDMAAANTTFDTDGMADKANDCITIKHAGLYLVTGRVAWATNGTGSRSVYMWVNGVNVGVEDTRNAVASGTTVAIVTSPPMKLAVGNKISLVGLQTSGASLLTSTIYGDYSYLDVCWFAA